MKREDELMDIDEKYRVKKTKGKSQFDKVQPYDIVNDFMNQKANVTFAQVIQDRKQEKNLREALKRWMLQLLEHKDWPHSDEIGYIEEYDSEESESDEDIRKTMAAWCNLRIKGEIIEVIIDSGAATNIITNKLRRRLGIKIIIKKIEITITEIIITKENMTKKKEKLKN